MTIPSDCPRGIIVALWTGSAPSVRSATSACPPIVLQFESIQTDTAASSAYGGNVRGGAINQSEQQVTADDNQTLQQC
jgi:hypothetical protein